MTTLIRESAPLRLHASIETPTGRTYRWGRDEPNPENVPSGITFSTTMPGGFEQCGDLTLPRKHGRSYEDLKRLSTLIVRGAGGSIAWEGRLETTPAASGDQMTVSPGAVGWQAHLDDNTAVQEIYVDQDASRFGDMPLNNKILLAGLFSLGDLSWSTQNGGLICALPNQAVGALSLAEIWYVAPSGVKVAKIGYIGQDTSMPVGWESPKLLSSAIDSETGATFDNLTFDGTLRSQASSAPGRYAALRVYSNGTAATPAVGAQRLLSRIAVYGDTGLPTVPIDASTPDGMLASDVVAHALGKWAPLLTFTTGRDGTIQPSTFPIPHLIFTDLPGMTSDVVKQATRFELPDWAVWENLVFWMNPRGARGRRWRARIRPANLQDTGPQIDRLWSSLVVQYCVDADTECLTKRGWRQYTDLTTEDELLAFNPETRTTRWENPREIFVNERYVGDMMLLDGSTGRLGALTTPDHRWPIYTRPRHGKEPLVKVFTSETLPREGHLIRRAPHDAPATPVHRDEIVRLAAWYFTEGHLIPSERRIGIGQSHSVNPGHIEAIRRDLEAVGTRSTGRTGRVPDRFPVCQTRLRAERERRGLTQRALGALVGCAHTSIGGWENGRRISPRMKTAIAEALGRPVERIWPHVHPSPDGRREGLWFTEYAGAPNMTLFRISGTDVDEITSAVPGKDKVPTMEFLTSLTRPQLEMFIDVCIAADGYEKKRIFYQHHPARMDAFMAAAVLAGKCPTLHAKGTACSLNERAAGTSLQRLGRTRITYAGPIWCPVTESGHWVARRRGKVFITGNTDVDGTTRTAGPPGSGCDVEDASLVDLDPLNPANQIPGLARRDVLAMSTSTAGGAIQVGSRFLQEQKLLDTSGQATHVGHVEDDRGVLWPAWMMRAGDQVSYVDAADPSYRRIVKTSYDDGSKTNTVTLDSPPEALQALLERMNVVLVPLGAG